MSHFQLTQEVVRCINEGGDAIDSTDKTVQRRIYDAENVMQALKYIRRNKKEIQWIGPPKSTVTSAKETIEELKEQKAELKTRIKRSSSLLKGLKAISAHNEKVSAPPGRRLKFPFIIFACEEDGLLSVKITPEHTHSRLVFTKPAKIINDFDIILTISEEVLHKSVMHGDGL
ncbi:Transcription factor DP like protein [Aduncisulcus paluster]|uniref:Transcription factor DP like protein n=1 Tax=Aduncisulcus paluster TaxID=2918883 RepID=A0ABQ5K1T9_9EUKA|nr:Transcription factor DP like protein [Aduncisulcus paluster]